MFTIAARYDWMGVKIVQMLPVLLPVALPPFTPMAVTHEIIHTDRLKSYTAGFR